jgi:hypothetical protein
MADISSQGTQTPTSVPTAMPDATTSSKLGGIRRWNIIAGVAISLR